MPDGFADITCVDASVRDLGEASPCRLCVSQGELLTMFPNASLTSPIYHLTLLSFCQLTSRIGGAKAFTTSEKLSGWPGPGDGGDSGSGGGGGGGPLTGRTSWGHWSVCRRPGRGAGWTHRLHQNPESVKGPVQ